MKVLIIEDEAPAFRRLQTLLSQLEPSFEIIDVIDSIADSVKWFNNHEMPHLIFSDIQLSDGLSFDIYRQVRVTCPIIFTTAFDEYMLDAFRTNGIDYLLKPIEQADLERSIAKFKSLSQKAESAPKIEISKLIEIVSQRKKAYKERFLVKVGTRLLPVDASDVAYFYHSDGFTEVILNTGKRYTVDYPLDDLENMLNPVQFFRLNRQFICRIQSVGPIHQYFKGKLKVILKPDSASEAIVSREKARTFKNWLEGVTDQDGQ